MIKIMNNQEYVQKLSGDIDKNNNMVIIGDGRTERLRKQLVYFDNQLDVEDAFADSPLSSAFKTARQFGCKHIFLINSAMKYDYIDIANTLMQYDFAYVVPTSVYMTDYFVDPRTNDKTFYMEYMLEQISEYNNSHIIATDKHASLFDDIDDYISYTEKQSNTIAGRFIGQDHKLTNITYVANNLSRFDFSNVALAAAMCSSGLSDYPNKDFGDAVFDIDELDASDMDFAFFQNNVGNTSVEHLYNLNRNNFQRKDVMIDKLIRFIIRNLSFDEYIGTPYNGQQAITIRNKITYFMDLLVGSSIENYSIKNIYFTKERLFVGNIVIELEITPIGRAESITILTRD